MTKVKRVLIAICIILAFVGAALGWWVLTSYKADEVALAAVTDENGAADGVVVQELADGSIAFVASEPRAGMVFYPGGNVQPEAYAPLLTLCAQRGITSILVRPPLNFALADIDAAIGASAQFPNIDTWYLAGHSLGGVAASACLGQHESEFDGIVLLASYPNDDLSSFEGKALQLVGTEDHVVSREKYDNASALLPSDAQESELQGGNHAQFGNYGEQKGDGIPTISREEQQTQTADKIAALV